MAHGAPDYGVYTGKKTVYALHDMAELAARLGSIVTFDRRGDVVFLEDFESGRARWGDWQFGNLYNAEISPDYARSGAFSFKLPLPAGAYSSGYVYAAIFLPVLGKMGVEFSFTGLENMKYVDLRLYSWDGTKYYYPFVRIAVQDKQVGVYDENYDFQTLDTDLDLFQWDVCFHTLKLVYDSDNNVYSRLLVDANSYDLSAYSLYSAASSERPGLQLIIAATNNTEDAIDFYIDDVIVTQNEP